MIRKILITNPRSEYVAITVDISFLRSLAPKNIAASSAHPNSACDSFRVASSLDDQVKAASV